MPAAVQPLRHNQHGAGIVLRIQGNPQTHKVLGVPAAGHSLGILAVRVSVGPLTVDAHDRAAVTGPIEACRVVPGGWTPRRVSVVSVTLGSRSGPGGGTVQHTGRCRCGKQAYRDGIAAKLALAVIVRKGSPRRPKSESRAYRCAYGRWHLTSKR